jgi:hypothetical protein
MGYEFHLLILIGAFGFGAVLWGNLMRDFETSVRFRCAFFRVQPP